MKNFLKNILTIFTIIFLGVVQYGFSQGAGNCYFADLTALNAANPGSVSTTCKVAYVGSENLPYYWEGGTWQRMIINANGTTAPPATTEAGWYPGMIYTNTTPTPDESYVLSHFSPGGSSTIPATTPTGTFDPVSLAANTNGLKRGQTFISTQQNNNSNAITLELCVRWAPGTAGGTNVTSTITGNVVAQLQVFEFNTTTLTIGAEKTTSPTQYTLAYSIPSGNYGAGTVATGNFAPYQSALSSFSVNCNGLTQNATYIITVDYVSHTSTPSIPSPGSLGIGWQRYSTTGYVGYSEGSQWLEEATPGLFASSGSTDYNFTITQTSNPQGTWKKLQDLVTSLPVDQYIGTNTAHTAGGTLTMAGNTLALNNNATTSGTIRNKTTSAGYMSLGDNGEMSVIADPAGNNPINLVKAADMALVDNSPSGVNYFTYQPNHTTISGMNVGTMRWLHTDLTQYAALTGFANNVVLPTTFTNIEAFINQADLDALPVPTSLKYVILDGTNENKVATYNSGTSAWEYAFALNNSYIKLPAPLNTYYWYALNPAPGAWTLMTGVSNGSVSLITYNAGQQQNTWTAKDGYFGIGTSSPSRKLTILEQAAVPPIRFTNNTSGNPITFAGTVIPLGVDANGDVAPVSSLTIASADINGGTIDGVQIGSTTPSTIVGTNITASGTVSTASLIATTADINGGSIDGTSIGATTASTIRGTTITATSGITGNLVGDVTGNVTGDILGDVVSTTHKMDIETPPGTLSITATTPNVIVTNAFNITLPDATTAGTDARMYYISNSSSSSATVLKPATVNVFNMDGTPAGNNITLDGNKTMVLLWNGTSFHIIKS